MENTETREDVLAQDDTAHPDPLAAVKRAAGRVDAEVAPDLDGAAQEDATEWLLAAVQAPPVVENTLLVNVGGVGGARKVIEWKIKALPGPMIRKIRDEAEQVVRRAGNNGANAGSAGFRANVKIVIEATTSPDIRAAAKQSQIIDPADVLETALQNKQGLIDQIAGSVMTLSGYDQEDVQDALETRAAGNS